MLRALIEGAWLIALPFAVWFAWRAWARRSGREMGATPWSWLIGAGAALFAAALMLSVAFRPDHRGQTYVPAEESDNGRVIPGRFEPKGPPR